MTLPNTDPEQRPLAPHIALVRLRAEAALVQRLNAGYGFADARIPAEIYLRDPGARERMTRMSLRPQDTHTAQAQEVAGAIAELSATLGKYSSPLTTLFARFGLNQAEMALLSIAVGYELDRDVRDLCHTLAWRRRPALHADVCQDMAPELADTSTILGALHPSGTLRRACLIDVATGTPGAIGMGGRATLGSELAAGRRALDWVLGDGRIAAPLHTVVHIYDADDELNVHIDDGVVAEIERVAGHLRRQQAHRLIPALVLVQGPLGAGKQAVAHRLCAALERPMARIGLREIIDLQRREQDPALMRQALTEARLRGAAVYLPGIDALSSDGGEDGGAGMGDSALVATDAIAQYTDVAILATTERRMPSLPFGRPFHLIRMPAAGIEVRQKAWAVGLAAIRDAVEPAEVNARTAEELAARYVIGPGTVGEVVADARAFARATGSRVKRAGIEEAVNRRLTMRLGSFGTLITRRSRMEEMVLPEDIKETLLDMLAMVRQRTQIWEKWGYGQHLGLNRGVSALFSGEPGTGKTMAASVISSALGLELIRIDLSAITSKWVGETEKHLAKIFDEAQTANAMLLFDEADSLFGKRTELKSAQDRYANLEVNYVLQRMETFDGVSVLTTNYESAIDPAFLRRLNFRLRFPKPEVEERVELWRRLLPPDTGLSEGIDFATLAERFVMTGGHIRNAIVRAAVVAARRGRAMEPNDLFLGAYHEYAEMGKVMPSNLR